MNKCKIWHDRGNCSDCIYTVCRYTQGKKIIVLGRKDIERTVESLLKAGKK